MNRDEIKKAVADAVVGFARSEAEAAIKTTTSWWVKIRNRLYITLMQQAVKAIVADVKQKIA